MNHRPLASGADAKRLAAFRCSTGLLFEEEVEQWIRRDAVAWCHDARYAAFQRRNLHLVENDDRELIAVFGWQDIVRLDVEGIWLQVLAVAVDHQHAGVGRAVLAVAKAHLATVDRDGDALAGLVHPDNVRSRELLLADGWMVVGEDAGHDLLVGSIS